MGRTNITVKDPEFWKWGKKQAVELELRGVSECLFLLLEKDREEGILTLDDSDRGEAP